MLVLEHGRKQLSLEFGAGQLLAHHRGPTALADPARSIAEALRRPFDYPALQRALTPEDMVTIVVDVPGMTSSALLVPILEELLEAGLSAESIALLTVSGSGDWLDDLPEHLEEVHIEEHSPRERNRLAYLATTKTGRRLYLNRTLVDADQSVVLTMRRYDLTMGYGGGTAAIFPGLSDDETRRELGRYSALVSPEDAPSELLTEANEVAWLLGQPFYVQLIPSAGDGIAAVVSGAGEALEEGKRRLDSGWRTEVTRRADCVLVTISGAAARQSFADLANAAWNASRVVRPGGRIVIVSEAAPPMDPNLELLRQADDATAGLQAVEKASLMDNHAARVWARAAGHARISLLSRLDPQLVEDLFATPLESLEQVERLATTSGECIVLQDGHRSLAVVR